MSVKGDPAQPLAEAIKELIDERPHSCDYYYSWEYEENRQKHSALIDKIFKMIGKKLRKKIWKDYFDIESLEGELHGGLQESSYRLGFNDALQLANQLNEAGRGQLNIFTVTQKI